VKTTVILTLFALMLVVCAAAPTFLKTQTIMKPTTSSQLPTAYLPPDQVDVWLTLGDESKKLSHEAPLTLSVAQPGDTAYIEINPAVRYQQFEGAGASLTESSAFLVMSVLDSNARAELLRNLFTREGSGIGLSYLRQPMGASDFALDDYTYDDQPAGRPTRT